MTAPALDSLAHYEFVKGLLSTLPSEITLYEGQVPDEPAFPYVVLRMATGDESVTHLCGTTDDADVWFYFTCVGLTDAAARVVARETRARVLDVRPSITGRSCGPIRKGSSLTIQPDQDVTLPGSNLHPMFGVDGYHFISRAA